MRKAFSNANPYVTIRCPIPLREAIQDYAKRRHTTVTQLTLEYYEELVKSDMRQEAEQL